MFRSLFNFFKRLAVFSNQAAVSGMLEELYAFITNKEFWNGVLSRAQQGIKGTFNKSLKLTNNTIKTGVGTMNILKSLFNKKEENQAPAKPRQKDINLKSTGDDTIDFFLEEMGGADKKTIDEIKETKNAKINFKRDDSVERVSRSRKEAMEEMIGEFDKGIDFEGLEPKNEQEASALKQKALKTHFKIAKAEKRVRNGYKPAPSFAKPK